MLQKPFAGAIMFAFTGPSQGSKPLVLILLYILPYLSGLPAQLAVRAFPTLLAPLFVFSTYSLALNGTQDKQRSALAAIIAAFSFNITVGVWAGYLANWLAIAEAYFLFATVLSFLRSPSAGKYLILGCLSVVLLLTHPQTWALSATVTAGFVISRLRSDHRPEVVRLLLILLGSGISIDLARTLLFGAYGAASSGIEISGLISNSFQSQLLIFWPSVVEGSTLIYNGLLANPILIGLGIPAAICLKYKDNYQRLLLFWIVLPSLVFPFFNSFLQTRIVYDLPIPILASDGLLLMVSRMGVKRNLANIALLALILYNANYAIRSMIDL